MRSHTRHRLGKPRGMMPGVLPVLLTLLFATGGCATGRVSVRSVAPGAHIRFQRRTETVWHKGHLTSIDRDSLHYRALDVPGPAVGVAVTGIAALEVRTRAAGPIAYCLGGAALSYAFLEVAFHDVSRDRGVELAASALFGCPAAVTLGAIGSAFTAQWRPVVLR